MQERQVEYFLGCKTKSGFVSLFEQLQNPARIQRLYILKGGPGSGKSTLMRRLGKELAGTGHKIEWIPCASDPKSLDAILDHTTKKAILDGTAPHVVDPKHPGAIETVVNAADAWEEVVLTGQRERIVELTSQIDFCHERATAYIAAAGTLLTGNRSAVTPYVDDRAVARRAGEIAARLQPGSGGEDRRLLSAVSVGELRFFDGTLKALADTVYTVQDDWGASSAALLERVRQLALSQGAPLVSCGCSMNPGEKLDHLIFPTDRLAVSTVNDFHATAHTGTITVTGLYGPIPEYLRTHLWQAQRSASELLEQAQTLVLQAKRLHDELEACYVAAMDFEKMDGMFRHILEDMKAV